SLRAVSFLQLGAREWCYDRLLILVAKKYPQEKKILDRESHPPLLRAEQSMESEGEGEAQSSNPAEETSNSWYLQECNRGEQLLVAGNVHEAAEVFEALLGPLGDAPSYERAIVLKRLSHCL